MSHPSNVLVWNFGLQFSGTTTGTKDFISHAVRAFKTYRQEPNGVLEHLWHKVNVFVIYRRLNITFIHNTVQIEIDSKPWWKYAERAV